MENIEEIKFRAKEIALQNELARHDDNCLFCRVWRAGGEMSVSIRKCEHCGERKAFSNIDCLIKNFAQETNKSYDEAWDIAYECLIEKIKQEKEIGKIYYDEDYFEKDLFNFYQNYKKTANKSETEQLQIKQYTETKKFCFKTKIIACLTQILNKLKWNS